MTSISSLPSSVATFFEVCNGADVALLDTCFTSTATVSDEHATHRGLHEIKKWLAETRTKYAFRAQPEDAQPSGKGLEVGCLVTGSFPGSPTHIYYHFVLDGEQIDTLEIG